MINLRLKVAQGAAWVLASRITINIIGLISTITLARLLVPSDFGIVSIALTIISIVDSFTNIKATAALIHQEDPTRKGGAGKHDQSFKQSSMQPIDQSIHQ